MRVSGSVCSDGTMGYCSAPKQGRHRTLTDVTFMNNPPNTKGRSGSGQPDHFSASRHHGTGHKPGRRNVLKRTAGLAGLAALSGAAWSGGSIAQENKYGILGYEAPELAIDYWIDADGEATKFSIAEAKGKWIFLKCFQNWCPGCHASGFPSLQAFAKEFHGNPKVAIAGIQTVFEGFSTNTQEAVRELQLEYELPVVMGHDPGDPDGFNISDTMLKYRTGGTPWLILIDPDGVVAFNDFRVDTSKLIEFMYEQVG